MRFFRYRHSLFVLLIALCAYLPPAQASVAPKDSIGTERKGGKLLVLHRVEPKETLYAIARRYNANVADIRDANPGQTEVLSPGQVLRVPIPEPVNRQALPANIKTHTVEASQTLFAISRMYNVTVEEIKKWNNLTSNELSVGQQLIVEPPETAALTPPPSSMPQPEELPDEPLPAGQHEVKPSETLYSIARAYGISVQDLKAWNQLTGNELSVGQRLIVSNGTEATAETPEIVTPDEAPATPVTTEEGTATVSGPLPKTTPDPTYTGEPTSRTVNITGYDKVVETGLAEVIDNVPETSKYLALHRTAPNGTILQIKNEMNGNSVFVRVIGRLPDTGNNDKVIVRISKKAFERLQAGNRRFLVEVSYIP
ncbi:LysM repeat-containing protein [Catalinimonas alkaloidigena]|uniref:LysM repeat-containing protein n=1 Tax=Catalinimonas alkaloidigena TaxID=1075417 RepID=A0A1G8X9T4_9BACT|nr:LysM peptidoglycan-binding domain-containing protein [Catalinimonas alkaloidigena]SDJ86510.1 LysM repeat-containing protein [Catalinimonas alkaloidigena]